jgi:hypothetical protein
MNNVAEKECVDENSGFIVKPSEGDGKDVYRVTVTVVDGSQRAFKVYKTSRSNKMFGDYSSKSSRAS